MKRIFEFWNFRIQEIQNKFVQNFLNKNIASEICEDHMDFYWHISRWIHI